MKRRAAYFLLCLCFCFSTLSLSSSAVETDYGASAFDDILYGSPEYEVEYDPYTGAEVLYDEAEGCYYSLHQPLEFDPVALFRLSSPNYPDFDASKLPWLDMPTYIQDIITAKPIGLTNDSSYSGEYKLPFVYVWVGGSWITIIAGYNLCVGAYFKTSAQKENGTPENFQIVSLKGNKLIYDNAVAYIATYNRNYEVTTDWSTLEPVAVGDNFVRYYYLSYHNASTDNYFYGSSGMYAGRTYQFMKTESSDSDMFPGYATVNNSSSGFASGNIVYLPDYWSGYIGTFSPPSLEALQQTTSKGILETLKQIPSNIANAISGFFTGLGDRISGFFDALAEKIKGFFLPSEGFFDTYVSDFQSYFKERLGLLYDIPELIIRLFQVLLDYEPAESGYSIHFPEVILPVLDNGEWSDVVIIEERDITFDFLNEGALASLYELYRRVLWLIYVFALINLIIRKSEKVFGGSSG